MTGYAIFLEKQEPYSNLQPLDNDLFMLTFGSIFALSIAPTFIPLTLNNKVKYKRKYKYDCFTHLLWQSSSVQIETLKLFSSPFLALKTDRRIDQMFDQSLFNCGVLMQQFRLYFM